MIKHLNYRLDNKSINPADRGTKMVSFEVLINNEKRSTFNSNF